MLGKHPLWQFGFGESPLIYLVVNAGVLGVERMSACFSSCGHTLTRHGYRNSLVGVSMEVPERSVNGSRAVLRRNTSTTDHGCGKKVWTMRDHIPRARTAHRLAHHVNTALINWELAAQGVDDLQCQPRPVP